MKAVLIAAGKGTRLNCNSLPKPLILINGRPLIERVILNLKKGGIKQFVIVVGYQFEKIIQHLKDGSELGVKISYVYNHEFEKELGLSVMKASSALGAEKFILSMADHLVDSQIIRDLIAKLEESEHCLLCVDRKFNLINDLESATRVLEENNVIKDLHWGISNYNCIDCGIFGLTPSIFTGLQLAQQKGKYTLSDGIRELKKQELFSVFDIGEKRWIGLNYPRDLEVCEKMIKDGLLE